jgi:uncharacterized cupredoxin-like copper-binding protein
MKVGATAAVAALAAGAISMAAFAGDVWNAAATVKVTETEWKMPPSPRRAAPGKITFVVRNSGKLAHEFIVVRTSRPAGKLPIKGQKAVLPNTLGKIAQFKPGQTKRLSVTLKAGKYVLLCNLAGHYKAGQYSAFSVG